MSDTEKFVLQGLAMANNYIFTGRRNKAVEMVSAVEKVKPDYELSRKLMHFIYCDQLGEEMPDLSEIFGRNWLGESLDGKSIEIFCDQGMGDTINLLRFVYRLKMQYECHIVLNCYAFFNQFERFMETQNHYIDEFVPFHVKCDYHTNIMSLPALMNGVKYDVYYPVHFKDLMEKIEIPAPTHLGSFNEPIINDGFHYVGVAWQTNSDNPLAKQKSIPIDVFSQLNMQDVFFHCLQPEIDMPNWVQKLNINDIYDTVQLIETMDIVVSVDTVVLHLAGAMSKPVIGLLPFDADPRWGSGDDSAWYPSMKLIRQREDLDWGPVISEAKECLVQFFDMK